MNLRDLSRPQWLAALESARILMGGNPNREEARTEFRAANERLKALLPEGVDHRDIVLQAAQWDAKNYIAAVCAGMATSHGANA